MIQRHKDWLEIVANQRCIVTGRFNIQVHHVVGREAVHDKIPIGHIWILPLWKTLHDVHSDHPNNVTHYPRAFEDAFGTQKDLFMKMINRLKDTTDPDVFPTVEEIKAIRGYKR